MSSSTTDRFSGGTGKSGKKLPVKIHIQNESGSHFEQENTSANIMFSYTTRERRINCLRVDLNCF